MAGTKIRHHHADILDAVGVEVFCKLVAEVGITAASETFGVGWIGVRQWLKRNPDIVDIVHQAKKDYAERRLLETVQIADEVTEDRDAISKARLRVAARQHLASALDSKYKAGAPATVINVGELHLVAVKREPPERPARLVDTSFEEVS